MKLFCAPLVSRLNTFTATSISGSANFPWYTKLYLPLPIKLDVENPCVALARSLKKLWGNLWQMMAGMLIFSYVFLSRAIG